MLTKSDVERANKRLEEARVTLSALLDDFPLDFEINYRMAVVLADLNSGEEAKRHLLTCLSVAPGYAPAREALLKLEQPGEPASPKYPAFLIRVLPYVLGSLAFILIAFAIVYYSVSQTRSDWTTVTYKCASAGTNAGVSGDCLPGTATETTRIITEAPDDLHVPQSYMVISGVLAAAAFVLLLLPVLSKVTIGPGTVSVELASTTQPSLPTPAA